MRKWWSKFRAALGGRRAIDDDLEEELRAHLQFEVEENCSRGMNPVEAQQTAQRGFGNKTFIKENARNAWRLPIFETFLSDIAISKSSRSFNR